MPIELTDADRANIAAAWVGCAFGNVGARAIQRAAEETYRAGFAAGIERAAKVCDEYDVPPHTYASENTDHYRGFRAGAVRCAAAIRGLLK